jgi:tetratricopeptide (TPR) repeat protein
MHAGSANAETVPEKGAMERAAKKACATGDFQKGVDVLADLFVATNDQTYVYNQGRCYQQSNRWEQAISRFREYLRKAQNLSDNDRNETERQIKDCQESLGTATQARPKSAEATSQVAHTPPDPAPETATPEISATPARPMSDGGQGRVLRTTGIVVAAIGLAGVGTGVGLALKARSLSTKDYSQSRESERSTLRTWVWASYGVGAAAIVTGAVLFVVGWPNDHSTSVAFLPAVAPGGASVTLQGGF